MSARTVLVVEDGTEYIEAFRRLAGAGEHFEFLRAGDAQEARRILAERPVDAIFLDVTFDRIAPERLEGAIEPLTERFGGDRRRAERHLASQQGFYVAAALADAIPRGTRVFIAFDFSSEPERLEALRKRLPELEGMREGTPISRVLDRMRESRPMSDSV
ncbi:MAG TPA: hypothetical protein VF376_11740 [Thermoanaerobaculia bacterium]